MPKYKDLDNNKFALGLDSEDFSSSFTALIFPPALYKGKQLYELLKYESNGHYYKYDDDGFSFYAPTQSTKKSSCFVGFRPDVLFENDKAKLSTIRLPTEISNLNCISFLLERIDINKKMHGIIKLSSFTNPKGKYFGMNYNIFNVNEINKLEILKIFNEISNMESYKILGEFKFLEEIFC